MITMFFQSLQRRWLRQHSLARVLARMDDHLLDDIGLTRHEAEALLSGKPEAVDPKEKRTEAFGPCPAC